MIPSEYKLVQNKITLNNIQPDLILMCGPRCVHVVCLLPKLIHIKHAAGNQRVNLSQLQGAWLSHPVIDLSRVLSLRCIISLISLVYHLSSLPCIISLISPVYHLSSLPCIISLICVYDWYHTHLSHIIPILVDMSSSFDTSYCHQPWD